MEVNAQDSLSRLGYAASRLVCIIFACAVSLVAEAETVPSVPTNPPVTVPLL